MEEDGRGIAVSADQLRGHLDAMVLALLQNESMHGYRISEQLRTVSEGQLDVPTGSLYPALHRLESAGWITSSHQTVAGRRRRVYTLTGSGLEALARMRSDWTRMAHVMDLVLET